MEKTTMTDSTIAFIGLGLIGGSIARAIRKTRPDIRIMAYMRSRSRLEQARKEGIVDVILDGIDENLRECDLIFLCTPVEYNAGYLSAIRPYLKQGALITDVGSTKCGIAQSMLDSWAMCLPYSMGSLKGLVKFLLTRRAKLVLFVLYSWDLYAWPFTTARPFS